MKVLILNFNLKGIGTYRRSFYFGRELARHGHQVTLVTVAQDSKYRSRVYYKCDWPNESVQPIGEGPWLRMIEGPNLGYTWLPGHASGPLDILLRIKEIIGGGYDAVYGFEYHPNVAWPVYLTKPFLKYRFYSDWCDWFAGSSNQFRGVKLAHKIDEFFEEQIRYRADKVSVTSVVLKERALAMGIPADRVVQIPEGAATDYMRPLPRLETRQRLGLPLNRPIIVAVRNGNMHREVLIFEEVLKQIPNTLFLMIGREAISALRLAVERGIDKQIIATGWVNDEDYNAYIACAQVCFCPLIDDLNDRARWPAKVIDFLSAGQTTVTNAVGEVTPLFEQYDVGVLAAHDNAQFADAIVQLLNDEEQARHYGKTARQVMVEKWDWRVRGKEIAEIVENR